MILGIDASNIRGGGGITHLAEFLNAAQPERYGFKKVYIWGGTTTLNHIKNKPWLEKVYESLLDKSFLYRFFWNRFMLSKRLKETKLDILFVPGGSYLGSFRPFVTMSQNLLPFEWNEMKRYGFSKNFLRFIILYFTQSYTFRKANGVIFLTKFARDIVLKRVKIPLERTEIVNHGINEKFFRKPKKQRSIKAYSIEVPFRILYVSFLGEYKHQWNLVYAVGKLRNAGYPVVLDLVGSPDEARPLQKLTRAIQSEDPKGKYIQYYSMIPYSEIEKKYKEADLFVFLSSCETFGQVLTEAMAAGLPIACSNLSAMPEILKDAGGYFNPLDVSSIVETLTLMINSKEMRSKVSQKSFQLAKEFSWDKAADKTFAFLQNTKHKLGK
ncbi:glycosyltransferase family 1 protein [Leptospira santarosai]|uniref:glycosyltransferase family 4 protein n=1 Tax=Leptospira santarosai TaxID=28183 RepID=UPI0022A946FC|nr:glycosyltransferase family 1 protein [Leptospira santarosai]MDI7187377.1 glycosyltransferase family 1 protein [Leptospira santarosai]MDI7201790.1 glycosyltransferase family 1 protein [Leptospira santarosai]UZN08582.1 glycosyltransferase family 4 protein [Leptospira santarosai]